MSKEISLEKVRLHYIYCTYGNSKDKPIEEVREVFSIDVGDDTNIYNTKEFNFYLAEDGEEYIKLFDDESPFVPWNKAFKKDGAYLGYGEICYFGTNYYDILLPMDEVDNIKDQLEKRRNELCLM